MIASATKWRGSVYARGRKLWLRFKEVDGRWASKPTKFHVGEERQARALLDRIRGKLAAGEEVTGEAGGPLTVRAYSKGWHAKRKALGVRSHEAEESHLRLWILPSIGDLRVEEVRPRHLVALVERVRLAGKAPRTVRNVYSTCRSMFRDAALADLIAAPPAILGKRQIGAVRDRDPEWRATAVFTRAEVERLISDERIPEDRRTLYALLALAGLRHGEAAAQRWRHLDPGAEPLGRLTVAASNDRETTKTGVERRVPVHPVLAAMLAEWKLSGWPAMFGRAPDPEDLVIPTAPPRTGGGKKTPAGRMRSKGYTFKRWCGGKADEEVRSPACDLAVLGLRHRRLHDLRRTFVSLCREGGADKERLRLVTHGRPSDVLDLYTEVDWPLLCAEVAKLRIERRGPAGVVPLPARSVRTDGPVRRSAPRSAAGPHGRGARRREALATVLLQPSGNA
jgi:integrase